MVCGPYVRKERNLQEVPSRHGAAQRLAFAYKGEGQSCHVPDLVAAASYAAAVGIGAMRWRSYTEEPHFHDAWVSAELMRTNPKFFPRLMFIFASPPLGKKLW